MKVIKVGGGCLHGVKNIQEILNLIAQRGEGHIFVVSALNGVTDLLIESMQLALAKEENIPQIMSRLRSRHMLVARQVISSAQALNHYHKNLSESLSKLERLYYGLNFTKEITPRMQDVISSWGERLSAELLSEALRSRGLKSTYRMPHKIGLITDGKFSDATARTHKVAQNLQQHLGPLIKQGMIVFVPGFFGVSPKGDITTFGRGGTDYSAAVVAAAMHAEILEIWKDVDGFMSADPKFVNNAQSIPLLSYNEAAELSYFGAKILHPRTVEPLRRSRINIAIKNTLNPDGVGSLVSFRSPKTKNVIKSVAYDTDIGIIKVHASGVGARLGVLAMVASQLAQSGINIRSVVTSQTCISLLLSSTDLEKGYQVLKILKPQPYRGLEKVEDVALVCIVGEGILQSKGIAARCFSAVAAADINIKMISFGPSKVALYFLVNTHDLQRAVKAIHDTFFIHN
jgi:aspartate kinase